MEKDKTYTVSEFAIARELPSDLRSLLVIATRAKQLYRERGLPITQAEDPRFGLVRSYHESILDEVVAGLL